MEVSEELLPDDEALLDDVELLDCCDVDCGAGADAGCDEVELEVEDDDDEEEDESFDAAALSIAAKLSVDCCEASERVDFEDAAWKAEPAKISDVTLTTLEPLAIYRWFEFSKERAKRLV